MPWIHDYNRNSKDRHQRNSQSTKFYSCNEFMKRRLFHVSYKSIINISFDQSKLSTVQEPFNVEQIGGGPFINVGDSLTRRNLMCFFVNHGRPISHKVQHIQSSVSLEFARSWRRKKWFQLTFCFCCFDSNSSVLNLSMPQVSC